MYGYTPTVSLLTGSLAGLVPGVILSHNSGHPVNDLVVWKSNPDLGPFHLASFNFIIAAFWLIAAGWKALYAAQRKGGPAIRSFLPLLRKSSSVQTPTDPARAR